MLDFLQQPGAAIVCAGLLGLVVGSFLNVVILRLPARLMHAWREQSRELLDIQEPAADARPPGLVWESSHCPNCKHKLGALENIPLASWLALRGRCRHCRVPISIQYPLIELLTGICSAAIVWKFGVSWQAGAGLLLTWILIASSGIDMKTQLLPDQLTLPLLWLGLLFSLIPLFADSTASILGAALVIGLSCIGHSSWLPARAWVWRLRLLGALGHGWAPPRYCPLSLVIGAVGGVLALRGTIALRRSAFSAAGWVWFLFADPLSSVYLHLFGLA